MDFTNIDYFEIITLAVVLIIAIVGHEIAHGYVAYKFGDNTAKFQGRLSINPINHIDILGTIVVPAVLYFSTGIFFGWAKPVPVNLRVVVQNGGYKAALYVALAGISYNLFLVILGILTLKILPQNFILTEILVMLISINLILAVFNLYPIPPLDGSKALEYILRIFGAHNGANFIIHSQRYGFILLIILLLSPLEHYFFAPIRYALYLISSLI